jgi:hypothetical protein
MAPGSHSPTGRRGSVPARRRARQTTSKATRRRSRRAFLHPSQARLLRPSLSFGRPATHSGLELGCPAEAGRHYWIVRQAGGRQAAPKAPLAGPASASCEACGMLPPDYPASQGTSLGLGVFIDPIDDTPLAARVRMSRDANARRGSSPARRPHPMGMRVTLNVSLRRWISRCAWTADPSCHGGQSIPCCAGGGTKRWKSESM